MAQSSIASDELLRVTTRWNGSPSQCWPLRAGMLQDTLDVHLVTPV